MGNYYSPYRPGRLTLNTQTGVVGSNVRRGAPTGNLETAVMDRGFDRVVDYEQDIERIQRMVARDK
jgi:hypothetical protein